MINLQFKELKFDDDYNFGSSNEGVYSQTPGSLIQSNLDPNNPLEDAARAMLGGNWQIPTKEMFQELFNNTDSEWINDYMGTGISGRKFMRKSNHSIYIFLPAGGEGFATGLLHFNEQGQYWSASYIDENQASNFHFNSLSVTPVDSTQRFRGRNIRPVKYRN